MRSYRIGRNYRPYGEGAYIGTRPGKASVQSICRRISDMTGRGWSWQSPEAMVESLNRTMTGWANYFSLGQVSPAYSAVNRHAVRRLRRWLCLKHKVRTGKYVRFAGTAMALLDGRALETIPIMEYVCERTYRALAIEELRAS